MNRMAFLVLFLAGVVGCGGQQTQVSQPAEYQTTSSGLKYRILKKTDGRKAEAGQRVSVHYQGQLTNGRVFDSSLRRGTPFTFRLGRGEVIAGWDEGIALLRVGEKAELVIPSALGYGDMGAPPTIPPRAVLIFEVELVGIHD